LCVAQDNSGSDEAYACHHTLNDALHDTAQGISILGHPLHLYRCDGNGRRSQRHQPERSHADRFLRQVSIDADERSG
jgi:hypothetical protein